MLFSRCATAAAAILLICTGGASARPVDPAENRFIPFTGHVPACDDWFFLNEITQAFNSNYTRFSDPQLKLEEFVSFRDVGYRTNGYDFIPRRYCSARARFNDGRERVVKYNLIEGGGFIGIGAGVEWCVVGQDPYHVYSPSCSAAGP